MIGNEWIDESWNGMTLPEKLSRLENNIQYLKNQLDKVPNDINDVLIAMQLKLQLLKQDIESANKNISDNTNAISWNTTHIGNLDNLQTTTKDNLVNAINELFNKPSSAPFIEVGYNDNPDITIAIDELNAKWIGIYGGGMIHFFNSLNNTFESIVMSGGLDNVKTDTVSLTVEGQDVSGTYGQSEPSTMFPTSIKYYKFNI